MLKNQAGSWTTTLLSSSIQKFILDDELSTLMYGHMPDVYLYIYVYVCMDRSIVINNIS